MTQPKPTVYYAHTDTPFGEMLVAGDGRRLAAVKFGSSRKHVARDVEALHRELHGSFGLVHDAARVRPLVTQLTTYLNGKRTTFDLELELSWITPFRRDVLLETARVPRGQVASYAEIAGRVGRPTAFRAVGNTMRTNPIPIVIPCHRVVGSNGAGGYGGGLDMKRRLLALEGYVLA